MNAISAADFDAWLRAYGAAWQGRDSKAAVSIFTEDALYYWTPLDPPQRAHAGIAAAWDGAVSQQKDITFRFQVLAVTGATGIATWRADFTRLPTGAKVVIEGVLTAEFAAPGKCRLFREWWHAAETPAATG
ncbi:MAG TPA: nuclear transport factor 2 family protein [Steroidobacteraceae bacterium]|nr:nuclear transport factor 2 family protein [Steroidobacteraceae bacterium]